MKMLFRECKEMHLNRIPSFYPVQWDVSGVGVERAHEERVGKNKIAGYQFFLTELRRKR